MLAVIRSGASCANRFDNPPDESQFLAMLEEICREIDGDIISASCCAFTGRAALSVHLRRTGSTQLEKDLRAGYCEFACLTPLTPMKVWLFFSVALLVYGFVFESTFAKDKSPTIATLVTALVAGSLMWFVWRIN